MGIFNMVGSILGGIFTRNRIRTGIQNAGNEMSTSIREGSNILAKAAIQAADVHGKHVALSIINIAETGQNVSDEWREQFFTSINNHVEMLQINYDRGLTTLENEGGQWRTLITRESKTLKQFIEKKIIPISIILVLLLSICLPFVFSELIGNTKIIRMFIEVFISSIGTFLDSSIRSLLICVIFILLLTSLIYGIYHIFYTIADIKYNNQLLAILADNAEERFNSNSNEIKERIETLETNRLLETPVVLRYIVPLGQTHQKYGTWKTWEKIPLNYINNEDHPHINLFGDGSVRLSPGRYIVSAHVEGFSCNMFRIKFSNMDIVIYGSCGLAHWSSGNWASSGVSIFLDEIVENLEDSIWVLRSWMNGGNSSYSSDSTATNAQGTPFESYATVSIRYISEL